MVYNIKISKLAQKEIEEAIDYYSVSSSEVPIQFVKSILDCYHLLSLNPYYKIQYKNIRTVKLKKFPYSLFYIINEERKVIKILSCFHHKRKPKGA